MEIVCIAQDNCDLKIEVNLNGRNKYYFKLFS